MFGVLQRFRNIRPILRAGLDEGVVEGLEVWLGRHHDADEQQQAQAALTRHPDGTLQDAERTFCASSVKSDSIYFGREKRQEKKT